MTTPIFPSVIGHNVLDGGTDAQDGNNYPGPLLQEYAAAVVVAAIAVADISRNPDGTVSGYTYGGASYAVTYGEFGVESITGGGRTITVAYDASGRIEEITNV